MLDGTKAVRAGEELPLERLAPWLSQALGPELGELTVEQFPGGHSNLTYLVKAGAREWVLRRPPFGSKVATAHDMAREVRVLTKLAPVLPAAPRPVAFCEDESVLGAKFYLMERIRGMILRRRAPEEGLASETARRLCESFVDMLALLHGLDYRAVGLGDFGSPEGYVARQVSGWTKRYRGSETDGIPAIETMASWLAEHQPVSGPPAIIHNDYKFDNLILDPADPTRIVGILDWEMATIGDPLMDLGTALCYWVEPGDPQPMKDYAFGPTMLPGMATRRELAARYAEKSGRDTSDLRFYYGFGLFKTAVVAQQIYYRYKQGLTKDPRFASFIMAVHVLAQHAVESLARPL